MVEMCSVEIQWESTTLASGTYFLDVYTFAAVKDFTALLGATTSTFVRMLFTMIYLQPLGSIVLSSVYLLLCRYAFANYAKRTT